MVHTLIALLGYYWFAFLFGLAVLFGVVAAWYLFGKVVAWVSFRRRVILASFAPAPHPPTR